MTIEKQYMSDAEAIMSHRQDNGADLWTTPDERCCLPVPNYSCCQYALPYGVGIRPKTAKDIQASFGHPVYGWRLEL